MKSYYFMHFHQTKGLREKNEKEKIERDLRTNNNNNLNSGKENNMTIDEKIKRDQVCQQIFLKVYLFFNKSFFNNNESI